YIFNLQKRLRSPKRNHLLAENVMGDFSNSELNNMKTELIYIEKETGANHNGLARIGKCFYSKSGQSVYFNGSVFKKCKGFSYNYFDIESGEGYWISGVKQDGSDRHKFGFGIIEI